MVLPHGKTYAPLFTKGTSKEQTERTQQTDPKTHINPTEHCRPSTRHTSICLNTGRTLASEIHLAILDTTSPTSPRHYKASNSLIAAPWQGHVKPPGKICWKPARQLRLRQAHPSAQLMKMTPISSQPNEMIHNLPSEHSHCGTLPCRRPRSENANTVYPQ